MKIGYVCTNYKNTPYTREALRSLLRNQGYEFRVVVVDNHSDRESVEELRKLASEFSQVELILSQQNVGYFRGLNLGIRELRRNYSDIEIIVVGNNDLVFPEDFGERVARSLSVFDQYAVVSPDILTLDGVHQNPHVVRNISKFREFVYDAYYANYYFAIGIQKIARASRSFTDRADETQHEIAQEIYQGYGACYLLGPMFFRHFEELWAPTFMLHEEYFLSKQLNDKGMAVYYEPSIKVLHHCRGAMSKIASKKAWELGRNAHKVYRQYVKVTDLSVF